MGNQIKSVLSAGQLAAALGLELNGTDFPITCVSPIGAAVDGALCFSKKCLERELVLRAVVIAPPGSVGQSVILAENPRLAFAKALSWINKQVGFEGDDSPAQIDPLAQVSAHAVIGRGVRIGRGTIVRPFAVIGDGTWIGEDSLVKSGAVIGEEGFGFERDHDGIPVRLVHLGNVRIGNRVEIGSLTTVCRGTLADTVIEDDAKIDDHVHIAHNVHVRRAAMVVACAEVSGGVELGEFSWVGPNASIIQKLRIGNGALIGIGANVLKSVEANDVVVGNPAAPMRKKTDSA